MIGIWGYSNTNDPFSRNSPLLRVYDLKSVKRLKEKQKQKNKRKQGEWKLVAFSDGYSRSPILELQLSILDNFSEIL